MLSYLIAGVALYGGSAGWPTTCWAPAFWLPLGIVLGAAFAVYVIIRRFGRVDEPGRPHD